MCVARSLAFVFEWFAIVCVSVRYSCVGEAVDASPGDAFAIDSYSYYSFISRMICFYAFISLRSDQMWILQQFRSERLCRSSVRPYTANYYKILSMRGKWTTSCKCEKKKKKKKNAAHKLLFLFCFLFFHFLFLSVYVLRSVRRISHPKCHFRSWFYFSYAKNKNYENQQKQETDIRTDCRK